MLHFFHITPQKFIIPILIIRARKIKNHHLWLVGDFDLFFSNLSTFGTKAELVLRKTPTLISEKLRSTEERSRKYTNWLRELNLLKLSLSFYQI
jgi:hypothetical protein